MKVVCRILMDAAAAGVELIFYERDESGGRRSLRATGRQVADSDTSCR
jgi:hypothetical protein